MERHHELRRPPGTSRFGCNLCGKEGHQAAQCPEGTVDWIDRFGLDTFVPKLPYYMIKPRAKPDYAKIEEEARLYAKTKEEAAKKVDTKTTGEKFQLELQKQIVQAKVNETLPQGWRSYTAPNGKMYYHHAATNKTQWTKPAERETTGRGKGRGRFPSAGLSNEEPCVGECGCGARGGSFPKRMLYSNFLQYTYDTQRQKKGGGAAQKMSAQSARRAKATSASPGESASILRHRPHDTSLALRLGSLTV